MNSDPLYPTNALPADSADSAELPQAPRLRQTPLIRYGLLGAAGLLLLAGSVVGFRALSESQSASSVVEGRVLPVETIEIEPVSSYSVPRIYTGEIVSLRSSELGFERGGELVRVMADEGEQVSVGTPLAELDIRNLETQRLQLEAQKAQAQARLNELQNGARAEDIAVAEAAVRDLEQQFSLRETQRQRREYLFEQGAIAREQLDEFSFGAGSLQAKLDQARSQLQELQNGTRSEQVNGQIAVVNQLDAQLQNIDVNLSKSTIVAPFDGVVASRKADEGTVIGSGQSVIEFVEAAAPEVKVGVPPAIANRLQIGSAKTIRVNDQPYQAQVTAVLPTIDAATRTQTVVLALDPTAVGAVEPGQTARLTVDETIQAQGFWLPTAALTQGIRGLWTCYVLVPASNRTPTDSFVESSSESDRESSAAVEQRAVEIIQQESTKNVSGSSTRVLVRGTLEPGDRVVTSGIHRLVPGQKVRAIAK